MSDVFSIVELSGPRREVHLYDRALPYKGLATPTTQRHVIRWYPGSPVATIQVLGPTAGPWKAEGMWKTMYLAAGKSADLRGFEDIDNRNFTVTAEDLVAAIRRICTDGQQLEVTWGPEVRRGILADFTPEWDIIEDIRWTMEFVWSQVGAEGARRATATIDRAAAVSRALLDFDAVMAEQPRAVTNGSGILAAASTVRATGNAFAAQLAKAQGATTETIAGVQAVKAAGELVVQACRALLRGDLTDLPYYDLCPVDDLASVLAVETWRRDTAASTRTVAAESRKATNGLADRAEPGSLAVVTVTAGVSLRTLALEWYGSADAWTLIADANGLVGAMPPVGTRLRIPRPPGQGIAR